MEGTTPDPQTGPAEHERYANFILPKNPREVTFKDTVQTLSQIFGDQSSLFNTRFQCLQLRKRDSDDFITYADIVNRECGRFQLGSLTEDQFKCLICICGLQSPTDADIRTRLLSKVHQNNSVTLQELAAVPNADQPQARLCNDSEPYRILLSPYGHIDQIASCYAAQASVQGEISASSLSALWRVAFPPGWHFPPALLPKL
ncbi:hypothetical protein SprV_0401723400 [Sparganum proliferum]